MRFLFKAFLFIAYICALPVAGISQTTLAVGAGQPYSSITAAYAAIPDNFSGPYVIRLYAGYSSANETFPLLLRRKAGSSATNTISIRTTENGLFITSTASATVVFDSCSYVTIEGGVNTLTEGQNLAIVNTSTTGVALKIAAGTMHSGISYCNIHGVNQSGTGGIITMHVGYPFINKVSFDHNNISGLANPFPANAIYIAPHTNTALEMDTLTISNNNIYDCVANGLSFSRLIKYLNISNNSFFHKNYWKMMMSCVNYSGTNTTAGTLLYGNSIGGRLPKCQGAKAVIKPSPANGGALFKISSGAGMADSNTITNIAIQDTLNVSTAYSYHILDLNYKWKIGYLQPNYIGDTSLNGVMTLNTMAIATNATLNISLLSQTGTLGAAIKNLFVGGIDIIDPANGQPMKYTFGACNSVDTFKQPNRQCCQ